jgi:hypothetical protein
VSSGNGVSTKNGSVPGAGGPVGNAGAGANGNAQVSWKHDRDDDHDRDHHHRRHRDRDFAFGFSRLYSDYDPSCYEYRKVRTEYGKRWIRVYICN